ncbi:MAG: FxsA family protein [Thiotrichaceae bacterium]
MTISHYLFVLFIVIPIIEIYLFIVVGSLIGVFPTIFLVILTAILGSILLQQQGIATLNRVHIELQQGQVPTEALLEGTVIIIGGALLLTPGFFTDFMGFLCLIPVTRHYFMAWLAQRVQVHSSQPQHHFTIDGEYRRDDE